MRPGLEAARIARQHRLQELGPLDRQGGVVGTGRVLVGPHVLQDHRDPPGRGQPLGAGPRHVAHEDRVGDQAAFLRPALVLREGIVAGEPDQGHAGVLRVDRRLLVRPPHQAHVEAVERKRRDEVEAPAPVVLDQQRRMTVRHRDLLQLAQPVADEPDAADLAARDGQRDVLAGQLRVPPGIDRGQLARQLPQRHPAGQRPGALAYVRGLGEPFRHESRPSVALLPLC